MNWVNRLLRRARVEDQLEKELSFHLEQHESDLIETGVGAGEARRQARIALGGPEQVKELCRDARGTRWLEDLLYDLRYAARRLRRSPGFAVVAVLTLALGIGATTAIFSAVNPILFEPLPYPHAGRVMMIWYRGSNGSRLNQSFSAYRELAERGRSFETIAVFKAWQPTLAGPSEPERLDGQMVTSSYFTALGVAPALGSDFQMADDRINGPKTVMLSDTVWRRRFGSDTDIVGRQVRLDDDLYTVAGVMPQSFENVLAPSAEVWSLLQYDASLPTQGREWGQHLRMVGRLRPGVGMEQARSELAAIAAAPIPEFARHQGSAMAQGLILDSLQDDVTRDVKPALLAILGAVVLVLLIACVNVTNLLLARGSARRGELAMRAALGAGRIRILRQMVTESLLLALVGGGFGMVVAEFGMRALVALSPQGLPRLGAIRINAAVFAFGMAISTLVGLAVGLIPALQASGSDLHAEMQQGSRRMAGAHQLARRTLVVLEVALALVLMVGAGLLLRSVERLLAVSPGFEASNLLTMQVQTYGRQYDDDAICHRFFDQSLEAVRSVPGVTAAAFTALLPLSSDKSGFEMYGVEIGRHSDGEPVVANGVRYAVTSGYFETMGIPLHRGRLFDVHDVAGAPVRPVIISESFASRNFPGQDPIGQRVRFGGPTKTRAWDIVVGVVGDVKQDSLALSQPDAVYVTTDQWLWADGTLSLVARTRGDAAALATDIKRAIWSIDKDQPIVRVATMDHLLGASEAERRFVLTLFEAFAIAALVLAAIGIYGVLSGSVTERIREIGVRTALGASRRNILALVLGQGMTMTGLGLVIGFGGAVAASNALVAMLFGVSTLDTTTYTAVIGLLALVSAVACFAPAWRAARVDPSITLRAE
jgi:putative ABC transport system permease protein